MEHNVIDNHIVSMVSNWNARGVRVGPRGVDYTGTSELEPSDSSNRVIGFAIDATIIAISTVSSTPASITGDSSRFRRLRECDDERLLGREKSLESPFSKSSFSPRPLSKGSITKSLRQQGHNGPSRCFINHSSMQAV
eukprot:CAMPEP_0197271732 /NCGR_PEP_ID=MMETSP1432-20130617/8930_1 /TAXON_ID=44447 /ORGANISM="Pseudo-nitzschia delicatissima, Strain UNC1205" /LENGTH=137 /DNA_ID=CAMNT_0042737183 /DNA_START=492 /DNA_END=905 /DNA_ORIENTATION=+